MLQGSAFASARRRKVLRLYGHPIKSGPFHSAYALLDHISECQLGKKIL